MDGTPSPIYYLHTIDVDMPQKKYIFGPDPCVQLDASIAVTEHLQWVLPKLCSVSILHHECIFWVEMGLALCKKYQPSCTIQAFYYCITREHVKLDTSMAVMDHLQWISPQICGAVLSTMCLNHVLQPFCCVEMGLSLCKKYQPSCTIKALYYYTDIACLARYLTTISCYGVSAMGLTKNMWCSTLHHVLN